MGEVEVTGNNIRLEGLGEHFHVVKIRPQDLNTNSGEMPVDPAGGSLCLLTVDFIKGHLKVMESCGLWWYRVVIVNTLGNVMCLMDRDPEATKDTWVGGNLEGESVTGVEKEGLKMVLKDS